MKNIDALCYKRNFISQVICRIDFEKPILSDTANNSEVLKIILNDFPVRRIDEDMQQHNLKFTQNPNSPPILEDLNISFKKRTFVDNLGDNMCYLSENFIIFEYNKFRRFEDLSRILLKLVSKINSLENSLVIARVGLRYINVFDADVNKPQKNYFVNYVSSLMDVNETDGNLLTSRAMGTNEYFDNDIRINARYGKYNKKYPGALSDSSFVLDYDAYIQGSYAYNDLFPDKFLLCHEHIQSIFESMITQRLRDILNE